MKKYAVKLLPFATEDIINLGNNIIERYDDFHNAKVVVDKIFDSINSLDTFPERAQIRIEVSGQKFRFLKSGKYTIIYRVRANADLVEIWGIFHSRQNIFEKFQRRLDEK